MNFHSVRSRLVALFIILSVLPSIVLGISINSKVQKDIVKKHEQIKIESMVDEVNKHQKWFSNKEDILRLMQSNYIYLESMINSKNSFDKVNSYLKEQLKLVGDFYNLYIVMEDGRYFTSSGGITNIDLRKRQWYVRTIKNKKIVWTQPYEDIISGDLVITVSMPLYDQNYDVKGVIGADFKFRDIIKNLKEIKIDNYASTYIINNNGDIVCHFGEDSLDVKQLEKCSVSLNNHNILNIKKEYVVACADIKGIDWRIISFEKKDILYSNLIRIRKYILYNGIITFFVMIILGLFIAKELLRPLDELKTGIIELQNRNYDYRVLLNRKDEFGELADAFNNTANVLKGYDNKLKRRTRQLIDTNERLQEMNAEYEAAYEQLLSTTYQLDKSEKEILKMNKELKTINKISADLNKTMDLEKMLQNVVFNLSDLLNLRICTIRLLREDGKLELTAYSGNHTELLLEKEISITDKIIGEAVISKTIIKNERATKEICEYYNKPKKDEVIKYFNIMPIVARKKSMGVLIIVTTQKLTESDFNILTSTVNQTAIMIENIKLYENLKQNYLKTIKALIAAVEAKDKYTEGHSLRVSKYALLIAKEMGLSKEMCEKIEIGGLLHDIGKIGINEKILTKKGKLNVDEYDKIKQHPEIGYKILERVGFSDTIMNIVRYHHKRFDLKGYPEDKQISRLPLEASIIGVADTFDAITSNRSYRKAMSYKKAIHELKKNKGTQFDPNVVDAMITIYNDYMDRIEEIAIMSL
ncbi:cyclic di-GMP phosphodiesterase response regulator RpfG [Clostridium tepidiprofundi DSM 19306]|uniref:Cyclic di-GMP phosphodiesterase response regulator RpfG n=1 Tax=Clostridium tepidiprofundi DSM 19306 TaxID=1121338 RepID=A0A151AVW6_9CLOT|nr:HD domain-containing phosphohydrolase [Clostridium tepidiprofundi]KYH31778.1 cyclic di-GMP phosphodiesterase response regulator RpfG [Clostridium tepidiprofundi DSM 19306]